jgi:hypothetical protein
MKSYKQNIITSLSIAYNMGPSPRVLALKNKTNRRSLLSSVTRTPIIGNNNNGNNGGNGNNNRNIITSLLLLLFGVLVTSLFVLLVFYEVNHLTGLLASLLEVGYIC